MMGDQSTPVTEISEVELLIDQQLRNLKDAISVFVSSQHSDLGKAVEESRRDLDVFKKAYMNAEREKREAEEKYEKERKTLQEEINTLSRTSERRVVVLIDGDGAIFQPSLIAMGTEGGHLAATKITESITRYLAPGQFQLHVYVFHNKRGLTTTLKRVNLHEAAAKFDDFIVGFNQAAQRFAIIDAGELKEGSDHKIRAYLDDNISSPQTLKVLFGGCHDNGYVSTLNSLITSGFKDKLILLPGYSEMAAGIEKLGLPSLLIPDLFLPEKITGAISNQGRSISPPPGLTKTTTPPPTPPANRPSFQSLRESSYAHARRGSDPGTLPRPVDIILSYKSAVQSVVVAEPAAKTNVRPRAPSGSSEGSAITGRTSPSAIRHINHKIPVWKHDPPPCTLFYLAHCKYDNQCSYAHDYVLNDEDFELIRTNAKANPCTSVLRGDACSWGDKCVYGHRCPAAPKCTRNAQGKCKFSAEGMHTVVAV